MTNQSTTPLRVGIIGAGGAGEAHLKAYLQIPGAQVVAIADPRPERLSQLNSQYNIPYLYENYAELVARDDIDVVSVATPNQVHAPATIAALESSKHVLCEKPLARNSEEGEAMVRAALNAKRVLKVAFNHRRRGDVQVLKRYIDEGGLGKVYYAKALWMRRDGIPGMGGWFTSKELAGGGPLIDLGVHVLDMAMYLLGEPEVLSVSASTYAELGPRGRGGSGSYGAHAVQGGAYEVEDLATAFIRLAGGVTLLLEASWASYGRNWDDFGVSLYGTEGGAEIDIKNYDWQNTLRIFTDTGGVPAEIRPVVKRGEGHLAVIREFIDIIHNGEWADYVGREGLRRTQIIDACYQSAREGREIALVDLAKTL